MGVISQQLTAMAALVAALTLSGCEDTTTTPPAAVSPLPTITAFAASPGAIASGGSSALSWSTTNATSVSIDPGLGNQAISGSVTISPAGNTTYTLTATGPGGTTSATATVGVYPLPVISWTARPTAVTHQASATFQFTVTDTSGPGVAQVSCQLDSGSATTCSGQAAYSGLTDGTHTFVIQTQDTAGNIESVSYDWLVDTTAPTVSISSSSKPTNPTSITTVNFQFAATDSGSGVASLSCSLDHAPSETCASPTAQTYVTLSAGSHTFSLSATDNAGNTSAATTFTWVVSAALLPSPSGVVTSFVDIGCPAGSGPCTSLTLSDNPEGGSWSGMADPSIRKDPNSSTLWMGYTYLKSEGSSPTTYVLETHLASSTDGGSTWTYTGTPLLPSAPVMSPVDGATPMYSSHEIINLLPVDNSGVTIWYSANLEYDVPIGGSGPSETSAGSYGAPRGQSSAHFRIAAASSPTGLGSAASIATLGFGKTVSNSYFTPTVNLSSLVSGDPSHNLSDCGLWNEEALSLQGTTLYLVADCLGTQGNYYAVFGAALTQSNALDPALWNWVYKGAFATAGDAAPLGAELFTEMDLMQDLAGNLIAVATPAFLSGSTEIHMGCFVFAMNASLETPSFQHDGSGNPVVLASVTESDLSEGPSSCTYDPNSSTGIVLGRKVITPTHFSVTLQQTGLKP